MSLIELIAGVEASEATLTLFTDDAEARETLATQLSDRNVDVVARDVDGDVPEFGVLSRDGEFVTAVPLADLLATESETDPEFAREAYRPILDALDETLFTSYTTREMVAASREIEDRAWRIGRGTVHAGFQTLDVLDGQSETYDRLGGREGLEVHAYVAPEGDLSGLENVGVHVERASEIRETWFVAYDGGGVDAAKCVLLAEEREPRRFFGFWSYDPSTVDYVIEHLTETYGSAEGQGEDDARA